MDRIKLFLRLLPLYITSNVVLLNLKQLLMNITISFCKVLIWTL